MSDSPPSMEARILKAVKHALAGVIKDTATPHGMRHPLSDGTIADLRSCLAMISARERELAADVGKAEAAERPRFSDEPGSAAKPIRLHRDKPRNPQR